MSTKKLSQCFLRYDFTYEVRVMMVSSSSIEAALEEDRVLFFGAIKLMEKKKNLSFHVLGFAKKNLGEVALLKRERVKVEIIYRR